MTTTPPTPTAISKCCKAEAVVPMGAMEVTKFYVCSKCKNPCDLSEGDGGKGSLLSTKAIESSPFVHSSTPDQREVTIGIDMGSGDSKSVVSLAKKEEDGTIHIIACESVSNELALFVQKQDDRIRSLEARNKELEEDKAKLLADLLIVTEALRKYKEMDDEMLRFNRGFSAKINTEDTDGIAYKALSSLSYTDSPTA